MALGLPGYHVSIHSGFTLGPTSGRIHVPETTTARSVDAIVPGTHTGPRPLEAVCRTRASGTASSTGGSNSRNAKAPGETEPRSLSSKAVVTAVTTSGGPGTTSPGTGMVGIE